MCVCVCLCVCRHTVICYDNDALGDGVFYFDAIYFPSFLSWRHNTFQFDRLHKLKNWQEYYLLYINIFLHKFIFNNSSFNLLLALIKYYFDYFLF